ncbi:heavy-metal-associated domain-containing protein [Nocardiopsis composta]|uniref:Copper ion binding protein n=1 Tax=Nocardiopsis composta TaxID=157465 RepID=A0A7W8QSW3_9ACTN|nr:copper ion binding protein [Nocardiopsis composta]MBB5435539.1 copper ion binding protein [Nocardiopsis composta]
MAATTITVTGMTCEHCVRSVKEEVSEIPGVTSVDVDLGSGRVDIASSGPIPQERLKAAIDEAGYEITG